MDVEEFLKKIPRPSVEDIPELYRELDEMTRRIAEILTASSLYNAGLKRWISERPPRKTSWS